MKAISPNISDGYIALGDEKGLRIVADGFKFTNEIRLDAKEEYLYIVETCGQCISRMRVQPDGSLTDREVYGPSKLGKYGFPISDRRWRACQWCTGDKIMCIIDE